MLHRSLTSTLMLSGFPCLLVIDMSSSAKPLYWISSDSFLDLPQRAVRSYSVQLAMSYLLNILRWNKKCECQWVGSSWPNSMVL